MAVYVDHLRPCLPNKNWRYTESCHMIADTRQELLKMAGHLRLKLSWFQEKPPHFDLTRSKRILAVGAGAVVLDSTAYVKKFHEILNHKKT